MRTIILVIVTFVAIVANAQNSESKSKNQVIQQTSLNVNTGWGHFDTKSGNDGVLRTTRFTGFFGSISGGYTLENGAQTTMMIGAESNHFRFSLGGGVGGRQLEGQEGTYLTKTALGRIDWDFFKLKKKTYKPVHPGGIGEEYHDLRPLRFSLFIVGGYEWFDSNAGKTNVMSNSALFGGGAEASFTLGYIPSGSLRYPISGFINGQFDLTSPYKETHVTKKQDISINVGIRISGALFKNKKK